MSYVVPKTLNGREYLYEYECQWDSDNNKPVSKFKRYLGNSQKFNDNKLGSRLSEIKNDSITNIKLMDPQGRDTTSAIIRYLMNKGTPISLDIISEYRRDDS